MKELETEMTTIDETVENSAQGIETGLDQAAEVSGAGKKKNKKDKKAGAKKNGAGNKLDKKGKKKFPIPVIIAIVAIILFGIYAYYDYYKKTMAAMEDTPKTEVQAFASHDMSTYVNVTGTVRSANTQIVTSTLTYEVDKVNVKVGDNVKKGDVLATIDTTDIETQITNLEAQASDTEKSNAQAISAAGLAYSQTVSKNSRAVSDAAQDLQDAKDSYEAAVVTATPGDAENPNSNLYISKKEYYDKQDAYDDAVYDAAQSNESAASSKTSAEVAIPSVSSTATELAKLYEQLDAASLVANQDGVVTAVGATEGSVPSGVLFQIEDPDNLEIDVEIKESDIFKVEEGQKVEITNDTIEDVSSGKVESVHKFIPSSGTGASDGSSAAASPIIKQEGYAAVIKVSEAKNLLLGMKVKAKIAMGDNENLMSVPYTAIMTDESDNSNYVYVAKEVTTGMYMFSRVNVEVGKSGDYYTEIIGGDLNEGDLVVSYPETVSEMSRTGISEKTEADATSNSDASKEAGDTDGE